MGAQALWLVTALVVANLPFVIKATMLPKVTEGGLALLLRLLEWLAGFLILCGFAWFLESRSAPVHAQNWQFYVSVLCMYAVFAFPGFVYCFLWRRPGL
ncbi:MAG: hypothetical protein QG667_2637 [Pseudomonadota bacterium]|jgi:hypothetical protein|nr:hypothetical protein [Pseudomonadota bacterium]